MICIYLSFIYIALWFLIGVYGYKLELFLSILGPDKILSSVKAVQALTGLSLISIGGILYTYDRKKRAECPEKICPFGNFEISLKKLGFFPTRTIEELSFVNRACNDRISHIPGMPPVPGKERDSFLEKNNNLSDYFTEKWENSDKFIADDLYLASSCRKSYIHLANDEDFIDFATSRGQDPKELAFVSVQDYAKKVKLKLLENSQIGISVHDTNLRSFNLHKNFNPKTFNTDEGFKLPEEQQINLSQADQIEF